MNYNFAERGQKRLLERVMPAIHVK